MDEYYITLQEVCKRVSLSPRTLRAWVSDPVSPLPTYKIGGKLLFRWSEVERWISQFKVQSIDIDSVIKKLYFDI